MSGKMNSLFPELQALSRAAAAMGQDIAKVKDELEKLVNMIIKDKIIQKKKITLINQVQTTKQNNFGIGCGNQIQF